MEAESARVEWVTTTIMIERLRDFQDVAWDQFTGRFRGPVIDFARRCGLGETEAQDLAQETLMAFAASLQDGRYDRAKGRLRSWLFGMAFKEVQRHRRRAARVERQAPSAGGRTTFFASIPDESEARATFDTAWDCHVLQQCLEQVRREVEPRTFRAFELVALRKRPASDVAGELKVSRNAVFIAKHRVLKRLADIQRQFEDEL